MSVEGEGSNGQTPQQTPQQPQQSSHPDLDFSLNDILGSAPPESHDTQFQTLVQRHYNNSNLEHSPTDFNIPVDLQSILDTDDILTPQGANTDASMLQGGNLAQSWLQQHQQSQQQQPFMGSPQVQHNGSASSVAVRPTTSPHQSNSNISTPSASTPNATHSLPQARVTHTPTSSSHPQTPQQQRQQPQASSTTLLDNITSQLPPEKKEQFLHLFQDLQASKLSAADFLEQAKSLLGQQQYQQLENLKNKPQQNKSHTPTPPNIRPAAAAASPMNMALDEESRKRHAEHIRREDTKRSMFGINTPPQKRTKVEHNNNNNITNNNIPSPHFFTNQTQLTPLQQKQQMSLINAALQQQGNQVYSNQIPVYQQQSSQSQPNTPQLPLSTPSQRAMQAAQPQPQMPLQIPPINLPQSNNSTPTTSAATRATIATPAIATPVTATPTAVATPAPITPGVFKAPAAPATPGLQVPTKMSTPSTTKVANAAVTSATQATAGSGGSGGGGGDSRIDFDQLTDVMAYSGVDLKDEEQFIGDGGAAGGILPDGIDRSKMQDFMNTDMLRDKILKYAKCVNIKEIDSDFISYLALAAQDRIRTIMESMVLASKHRTRNPFKRPPPMSEENDHPLFKIHVKQNVRSQLQAIERVSSLTEQDIDPPSSDDEEDEEMRDEKEKGWFSKKSKKMSLDELKGEEKAQPERKITVQDAIFVMERDVQGGRGCNQKALLRAYNEYLL